MLICQCPMFGGQPQPQSYVFGGYDQIYTTLSTSAPNQKLFSVSVWCKYNSFTANGFSYLIFDNDSLSTADTTFRIHTQTTTSQQNFFMCLDGSTVITHVFIPNYAELPIGPGVWTHYLWVIDTAQATNTNRIKLYVDGVQRTLHPSSDWPALNADIYWLGNGSRFNLNGYTSGSNRWAGKMAFIDIIDGAAIAPTDVAGDVGGTWTAKKYTGSYGTNGMRLWGLRGFTDEIREVVFTPKYSMSLDRADMPPYSSY